MIPTQRGHHIQPGQINTNNDLPAMPPNHTISRLGGNLLESTLIPWIVTPFPAQNDYGIDGNVQITKYRPGELTSSIIPVGFQFQLKSTTMNDSIVTIRTNHIRFWLAYNIPIVLFLSKIPQKMVYWRCMDEFFLQWLQLERPEWQKNETVSISFSERDIFNDDIREDFIITISQWQRSIIYKEMGVHYI